MFTGEYRHAVDDKGRLAVPSRFRAQLAGNVVVARWMDTCLAIFPTEAWEELSTKVGSLPMTDRNARLLQRQLFAGAFETELDRQGRLLVPQGLRTFA
ncbi:MAG: division/cell wall cluster transcriptional repressor MraZ, partial [Candidatus Limnocylindrales bacterium]